MGQHRIIVLGGGYTGIVVAGQLARRMRKHAASVTLVTGSATRDERMRWHQLAAGQKYPVLPIAEALAGTGAELDVARVERIDLESRHVLLADRRNLRYDSLVVALGSVIDFGTVPGVRENAQGLTDVESVMASARRLDSLPDGASVVVIGGGLTGIELATEVAESHPRLRVTIASSRAPGYWLSERGLRHLERAFERLGIESVVGRVADVGPESVGLADGRGLPSALTLWAGGFRANPVVEASGLRVDELGRAYVDEGFHPEAHPEVWVVGDAARVLGRDGVPLKMGCRTGAFMAQTTPRRVAEELAGAATRPFTGRYFAECMSLGRRDALLQWLTPEGAAIDRVVTGRTARLAKEFVHRGNLFVARHPGPYWFVRRARIRVAAGGDREMIEA